MDLRGRLAAIGIALLATTLGAGCGSDGATPSGGPQSSPSVTQLGESATTTTVGSGAPATTGPMVEAMVAASVHEPIDLVARPGDDDHLWLAERAGRVRRLTVSDGGNSLSPTGDYALDISDQVSVDSERGLLGLAFSPDGGKLYLSYTDPNGNTRVVSYEMSGNEVTASTREVVFSQDQPYSNHNGGHIAFGPDGKLWLGLGDGGAADDPENRAQDPTSRLGKMLRIDPTSRAVEIMVSGVRNPWRWSFDTDDSLWIGDVGQNQIEEIDHLPAGEIDGANLGWSGFEGSQPYMEGDDRRPADATGPVFEYSHDDGNCSVTGGFVYRGEAIPALEGAYLFADFCAGRLRAITLDESGALGQEFDLGVDVDQPVSFAADPQGEPYVLSQGGNIVRLLPPA